MTYLIKQMNYILIIVIAWSFLPPSVVSVSLSAHRSYSVRELDNNNCLTSPCAPGCCTCSNDTATVVCNDLNITSIPTNLPQWTQVLIISLTNITMVSADSFASVPNLTHLYLVDNLISHIEDDTFVNLTQLRELRLDFNKLQNVTSRTFANSALTRLRLDGNLLTSIPDLGSTSKLHELYLTANNISDVTFPTGYKQLLNLSVIYLDANPILTNFTRASWTNVYTGNITDLSCNGCNAPVFEENFFTLFPNLERIYLANNFQQPALTSIIANLGAARKLKKLDISDVISIDYTLYAGYFSPLNSTALEDLNLVESTFSKVPKGLFTSLNRLKILNMKLCKINFIENGAFDDLLSLEVLYLDNSLTGNLELGYGLFPPSLHSLSLANSYLPYFSYDNTMFKNLTKLKWLRLSNSFIDFIPPDMFPPSLTYLDLSTIIFDLGMSQSMLKPLTSLISLDLTSTLTNQQVSAELFDSLYNVEHLILSKNGIHTLVPGVFHNMKVLQSLDLSYNALSSAVQIDVEIFGSLQNLTHVSLVRNSISDVSETEHMDRYLNRNGTVINLSENPFSCSCDNVRLLKWLQSDKRRRSFISFQNYTCASPEHFAGRRLVDDLLVGEIERGCGSVVKLWEIIAMVASAVVSVVAIVVLVLYYKYRLYIQRLFEYRIREQTPDKYDLYLSYISEDITYAEQITAFIEQMTRSCQVTAVNVDDDEDTANIQQSCDSMTSAVAAMSSHDAESESRVRLVNESSDGVDVQHVATPTNNFTTNWRVYYEDRDSRADEWDIEQLARAIYSSTSIILCLTSDYLKDKRRQYEMVLAQDAMVHRYGLAANDHVVLIVLRDAQEVASHVPDYLRAHYNRHAILWNDTAAVQHSQFWTVLKQTVIRTVV